MTTAAENSVAISSVVESPINPRKRFEGLEELAESIRTYGVLQPILVRPADGHFECVFGHRRLRAAKLAKLEAIPAIVRELTDAEVLEAQLVENLQRQDIHPLEEGAVYREMHERLGYSADEIAAKVGKSRATIYSRMQLCQLAQKARDALLEGKLSPSIALLIARIPHEKLQLEAMKRILDDEWGGEPMSYRRASDLIQADYMLQLSKAPFNPKDAALVPEAGACVTCPRRAGAQPELFPEVSRPDVCTDPICYAAKLDAVWGQHVTKAKTAGQKVLTQKEAKEVFRYGSRPDYRSGYVDLDETVYLHGGQKIAYRKLAKKAGRELEVALARDPHGGIRELVERKVVDALVRKENKSKASESATADDGRAKAERENERWKRELELRRIVDAKATEAVVQALSVKAHEAAWLVIFDAVVDGGASLDVAAKRRGLVCEDAFGTLRGVFASLGVPGRLAMLVELIIDGVPDDELLTQLGIDRKALEVAAKAELKEKRQAEAEAKKAKAKGKGTKSAEELIRWEDIKRGNRHLEVTTTKGRGAEGRQYTITESDDSFGLMYTGNNGALCGVGAGGSYGAAKTLDEAKAAALEHERSQRKQREKAKAGVCQKCGYTDDEACPEGCSWANAAHTLCSSCA